MIENPEHSSASGGDGKEQTQHLSSEELRELEELLVNRREFLQGNVQKLGDQAFRKGTDGGGDHSSVPLHAADLATDAYLLDMSLAFIENESGRLQEIDDALERIRDGSFGRCESCDEIVGVERLRAVPYARYCLSCQKQEEQDEQEGR